MVRQAPSDFFLRRVHISGPNELDFLFRVSRCRKSAGGGGVVDRLFKKQEGADKYQGV